VDRSQESKVVVKKKETSQRITETDLFKKRTREGRRSITIIAIIQRVRCVYTNDNGRHND